MAYRSSMNAVFRSREPGRFSLVARLALLAGVACAFCSSGTAAELDRVRFIALARSVLKVEAIKAGGGYALGTAVAVAPGRFVTNCHVTHDAQIVMLVRGGARWRAESQRADLLLDLCMLEASALVDVPSVPLSSARSLRVGDAVAAAGYTGGAGLQMHAGTVTALHAFKGSQVIQTTTAFTSGASGGALFDADGRLVGILTFRLRGADGYYFAAPTDWIADVVADTSADIAIGPLDGSPPFWAQPLDSLPFFMQAASLSVDERWSDLLRLADRWIAADGGEAESWFMRGTSLAKLDRPTPAVEAFRHAVALDPRYLQAWLQLGKTYLRIGAVDDARRVAEQIDRLQPGAAAELGPIDAPTRP